MMKLLGIIGSLSCCQVVYSQNIYYVPANITQAREKCYATGLVLPADNMRVAQRLQQANISGTWIDLAISPSPWNWITDDEYTVHYDQGCYNLSSLPIQPMANDINTCLKSCFGYLYVGVQSISADNISCVCTNEIEITSAVSEFKCNSACNVTSNSLLCGNGNFETFRLLSTRELSSLPPREVTWYENPGFNFSLPFLCASLSIKTPYIRLLPQDCTTPLPAICELDNGTVTRMDRVSWFGARQLCCEHGMKSVRVSSTNKMNILAPNFQEGWTALRGWTWRSQSREICDTVPSNWSAGYPKKSEGECIVVLKDGSWKNVHCHTKWPFICEISSITSLRMSTLDDCRSSNPSTSANTSDYTTMMEASTASGPIATTTLDQLATTTLEQGTAATPAPITTATPETAATSKAPRDRSSYPPTSTSSLTEVINTTSSTDSFTTDYGPGTKRTITGSPDVAVAAAAGSVAFLVLTAVTVIIIIICLRKRKQATSRGSPRDPGDDKSLRPECDQSMDELPIYARPNKDPPTDGVIMVMENSLYGSVDLDDDELPSSRPLAPALAYGQGVVVYEQATVSMRDEVNHDSTYVQEAGDLSIKDQVPDDDTLMIDNSLYDSTDSALDGLPVP